MIQILNKRIKRELKENFVRYLSLMLLIALGMFMVISIVAAAETIIIGTDKLGDESRVEDGQFTMYLPLTDSQKQDVTAAGFILEEAFSIDTSADDGTSLRVMALRERINLITLDSGTLPSADNECVLEQNYAAEHDLAVGDTLEAAGIKFTITGIGTVPDYDAPYEKLSDTAVSSYDFGLIFVTANQYAQIKESGANAAESYTYSFLLGDGSTSSELKEMAKGFPDNALTSFVEQSANSRIAAAAGDVVINKSAGLMAGVVVLILFTYVISVFVVHQIQQESSVISALYALGAKRKDIIFHYITLPSIIALLGGIIGTFLGFSPIGQNMMLSQTYAYFSIPVFNLQYPAYLIIYGIVLPPLIATLVNAAVIGKRLSGTALSLLRNEQKAGGGIRLNIKIQSFVRRFQLRQMLREIRTSLTVIACMLLALLVLMLALDCYALCVNVKEETSRDTLYEYMYIYKQAQEAAPDDEAKSYAYVKDLSKTKYGYTLDVTVLGISSDNPYFPTINTPDGKNQITASSAAAQKYGLKVGDTLTLTDDVEEKDYEFIIAEIDEYAAGLIVFMNIDQMRELFGIADNAYNCIFSGEELDIDESRLYAVTSKADIERAAGVFVDAMRSMVIAMIVCAIIICFAVMYLMQGVMIDRASYGISLLKTFGYRAGEVKKLYLDGNLYTVIVGALVGVPLSKLIMDAMYPMLIANIASGMNLEFTWQMYAVIFVGIFAIYFANNMLLSRKLGKITPAQVLKNRE